MSLVDFAAKPQSVISPLQVTSVLSQPMAMVFAFACFLSLVYVAAHGDVHMYCATECTNGNTDPCGDGKGQQEQCASTDFVIMGSTLGYTNGTGLPDGFLGCSDAICDQICHDVNVNETITVITGANGIKTFCFPEQENMDGMHMMKDCAEMSALSRGCSGSHQMGEMWMHGNTHMACMSSYNAEGFSFSSAQNTVVHMSVVVTLSSFILSFFLV